MDGFVMPDAPTKPIPSAPTTLVVVFGASQYTDTNFASAPAFANMAAKVRTYFVSPKGFSLPDPANQLLYLFDVSRGPPDQLNEIEAFVRDQASRRQISDLILWYIGHGTIDHIQNYCLTLRGTLDANRGATSIRITDLGHSLTNSLTGAAKDYRTYLLIDACYSGRALEEFMGDPDVGFHAALGEDLPKQGVAALCSAPKNSRGFFDAASGTTVFSSAVLGVLNEGIGGAARSLALEDVHNAALQKILAHPDPQKRVRPVFHNPRSDDGPISRVPLFPNLWSATDRAPRRRRFQAVIFDLDGTLLVGYQYSWSLIWSALGYPEELRIELLRRARRRDISYAQWCEECCRHFRQKDLTEKMIKEIIKRAGIHTVRNYGYVMRHLRESGYLRGIVSGGIDTFLGKLRNHQSDFRHIFINRFHYAKSGKLSHIEPTPYDFEQKWDGIVEFCRRESIDPKSVVFVGDSVNDITAAERSQLSIAFSGSSRGELKGVVDRNYSKNDLKQILSLIQDRELDGPSLPFPKQGLHTEKEFAK
jgi:HAD superfamily phosphoserine phosphatase-like hydrolase